MTNFTDLALTASRHPNKGGKAPRKKKPTTRGQSVPTAQYVDQILSSETAEEEMEDEREQELQSIQEARERLSEAHKGTDYSVPYCSICGDGGELLYCHSCPVRVCASRSMGETGCVVRDTVEDLKKFTCPPCLTRQKNPMQYVLASWAFNVCQTKEIIPLCYVTLKLSTLTSYVLDLCSTMLVHEYRDRPTLLCTENIRLIKNPSRRRPLDAKIYPALEKFNHDANFLVLVDTHSVADSGALVFGGSPPQYISTAVDKVLSGFMDRSIFEVLQQQMSNSVKGLVLMACGPAMTVPHHFMRVEALVEQGYFSFAFGFCGESVIPTVVGLPTTAFIRNVFIQKRDIRTAFLWSWLGQVEALRSSPVVLVYSDGDTTKSEVLTYSVRGCRMWGLSHECGTRDCWNLPGDVKADAKGTNHAEARFTCLRCRGKTGWIKRPSWLLEHRNFPYFFSYTYPLTTVQRHLVRNATWAGGVAPPRPTQAVVLG